MSRASGRPLYKLLAWAVALAALAPRPCHAKGDIRLDPDLMGRTYPGVQGIQTLDGKYVHNVGNILLNITNFGLIGSAPGSTLPFSGAPSAQWPAGSSTEYLYVGGLWIGAMKNGEAHVTTAAYEIEFRPGRS